MLASRPAAEVCFIASRAVSIVVVTYPRLLYSSLAATASPARPREPRRQRPARDRRGLAGTRRGRAFRYLFAIVSRALNTLYILVIAERYPFSRDF